MFCFRSCASSNALAAASKEWSSFKKKKKLILTDCVQLILPSGALQATRALMIVSIIVTLAGLGVACMGMKCTNCGGDDKTRKSRIAMTGGIIILVGGEKICIFFFCFHQLFVCVFLFVCFFVGFLKNIVLPILHRSSVFSRCLLLVRSRHHPGFLQSLHPRQYKVSMRVDKCSFTPDASPTKTVIWPKSLTESVQTFA